jgi:class 3 adenylate cyclase/streptogramin lyase
LRRVAELPSGTVTFLFTDIEGSTQLLRRLGERYSDVLAAHYRILRAAAEEGGGRLIDTQGDSCFFAFARANAALGAAVVAQRALGEHDWPVGSEVRVRMGLHTGEPEVGEERYVGLGVHRASRIGAAAHGGQVLLSSATRELVEDEVGDVAVRDLGSYRLKDFDRSERLYQLDIDGLRSRFPPVRATPARSGSRRWLLAGAFCLVAALAAVAAVLFTSRGGSAVKIGPNSLAVIDPKSNKVVDAVDLGFKSGLIAAGEGYIWVVDPDGSTLWRIDPHTRATKNIGISVGAGAVPFGVAAGFGAVWVAVLRGTREVVLELGPDVGDLRRTIPYGGQANSPLIFHLQPLAVGAGAVWAIDPAAGAVWRIPPRGGGARKLAGGLDALALAAGYNGVWVAGSFGVTKIDPSTGVTLGSTTTGAPTFGEAASVALGANAVWFATSSGRSLSKLDPQSVSTSETFAVGRGPTGVAVGEGAVWVANSRDGTVSRVDPSSRATRTINLGRAPGGVVAGYGAVWTSPGVPRS